MNSLAKFGGKLEKNKIEKWSIPQIYDAGFNYEPRCYNYKRRILIAKALKPSMFFFGIKTYSAQISYNIYIIILYIHSNHPKSNSKLLFVGQCRSMRQSPFESLHQAGQSVPLLCEDPLLRLYQQGGHSTAKMWCLCFSGWTCNTLCCLIWNKNTISLERL